MSYYVWFSLFAICAYLIAVDQNVAKYFILLWKQGKLTYEKVKWWVKYSPDNPIVRYQIKRNSEKLAQELFNELQNQTDSGSTTDRQSDQPVEGE
jgi:hypothetical protein